MQLSENDGPESVDLDGKKYELSLRFKRDYKPYAIELIDAREDDYIGTSTPQNYSSDVKLIYPDNKGKRDVSIWMNNPLRYAGETFYQSGFKRGNPQSNFERERRDVTTLQVVKNTGWMIPYLGCMIVVVGMAVQFNKTLLRFVMQREAGVSTTTSREWPMFVFPAATVVLLGLLLVSQSLVPRPVADQFDFYQFGQLPIVYEGRVKPFDTLARNTMRILSGKQYYLDQDGKKQPAERWLLRLDRRAESRISAASHPDRQSGSAQCARVEQA